MAAPTPNRVGPSQFAYLAIRSGVIHERSVVRQAVEIAAARLRGVPLEITGRAEEQVRDTVPK